MAFQGSLERATEVDDRKIQEQLNVSGSGLRASRAQNTSVATSKRINWIQGLPVVRNEECLVHELAWI